jgi:hypothetical protein
LVPDFLLLLFFAFFPAPVFFGVLTATLFFAAFCGLAFFAVFAVPLFLAVFAEGYFPIGVNQSTSDSKSMQSRHTNNVS